jgi:hypothetical protein
MTLIGYAMMCEQADPKQLARDVALAGENGSDPPLSRKGGNHSAAPRWPVHPRPGRGRDLDEHIVSGQWPLARLCHEMLGEAVEIILAPWEGGMMTHYGKYLEVESAKVCDLPNHRPANGYRGLRAGRGVQR